MGVDGVVVVDEAWNIAGAERGSDLARGQFPLGTRSGWIVVAAACFVFLVNIASPPRLMDDVDAVQAQIARNMLASGDWVTARLDGVAYLEKSPLIYWMMAGSYAIFGVHDWAARLPLALAVVLLCWITYRFGRWAFGQEAGTLCRTDAGNISGAVSFHAHSNPGRHPDAHDHARHLGMAAFAGTGRTLSTALGRSDGSLLWRRASAQGTDRRRISCASPDWRLWQ